ncbi:Uncharacterized protein TCM_004656 [Theobroma cacao]|uniref:Uncharacterized protein n=1 Tax=Theobroma cacao TaxID=3641 RepID=A0A061DQJ4_THECC|nr:Uncharacterized protein TCM_004656 [Theobroma cacao]
MLIMWIVGGPSILPSIDRKHNFPLKNKKDFLVNFQRCRNQRKLKNSQNRNQGKRPTTDATGSGHQAGDGKTMLGDPFLDIVSK